ncbi:hypothetical protein CEXT_201641 [Caerostris extrusa]|uniref:Secreted protein n=1 Tax=Caerostris extrusa TaxID=172846 RepID=A0AAV4PSL5_CAEEX|nr:hypothetical protein CEXT_201641 [Caerostris extrusa]
MDNHRCCFFWLFLLRRHRVGTWSFLLYIEKKTSERPKRHQSLCCCFVGRCFQPNAALPRRPEVELHGKCGLKRRSGYRLFQPTCSREFLPSESNCFDTGHSIQSE